MKLPILFIFFLSIYSSVEANLTTVNLSGSKAKRTLGTDIQNYGENKQVVFLLDNVASPGTNVPTFYNPRAFVLKPAFEPPSSKHVAAQQVLYEFQQTPTNTVSNVHVNQLLQPVDFTKLAPAQNTPIPENKFTRNNNNPYNVQPSESITNPVQHSNLVNNNNYGPVQFLPQSSNSPQHFQTQHYIPGKYLYINGKIIYQPAHFSNNPHQFNTNPTSNYNQNSFGNIEPNLNPNNPYQTGVYNSFPNNNNNNNNNYNPNRPNRVNYITHPNIPSQKLTPPKAMSYSKFQPPSQLQPITKPMVTEQQQEEAEEEEDNAPVRKGEEEENEEPIDEDEHSSYREQNEDEEGEDFESASPYESYSLDDEDEDDHSDHSGYHQEDEENEDDEDSHRGSSKVSSKAKKPIKKKKKYGKPSKNKYNNNYKYKEEYETSTKYESPKKTHKKSFKGKNPPKMKFKSVRYSTYGNGKPKIETLEGRQSQHIPVIEKQKVLKEKWYFSKTKDSLKS